MAMHVEHMSRGLCPVNICPAPREGDLEAAAVPRWRPVLVVIVTTCMLQCAPRLPVSLAHGAGARSPAR